MRGLWSGGSELGVVKCVGQRPLLLLRLEGPWVLMGYASAVGWSRAWRQQARLLRRSDWSWLESARQRHASILPAWLGAY